MTAERPEIDAAELMARCLHQTASDQEWRRLDALLAANPATADQWIALQRIEIWLEETLQQADRQYSTRQVIDALHARQVEPPAPAAPSRWRRLRDFVGTAAGASAIIAGLFLAIVVLSLALLDLPQIFNNGPAPLAETRRPTVRIVASLAASLDAQWAPDSAAALAEGPQLFAGQQLDLRSGVAEVQFDSGAALLVEGPVTFELLDVNAARLDYGRVYAKVPAAARGFRIDAAAATVIDLGTEFGMEVHPISGGQVEVFDGLVQVQLKTPRGPTGAPLAVRRGQTLGWTSQGTLEEQRRSAPQGFVQALPRSVQTPLPNTGVDVAPGEIDPRWQVRHVESDDPFEPAYAIEPHPAYTLDSRGDSHWISIQNWGSALAGTYRFRTEFNLKPGVDPSAVTAVARVASDNQALAVRLNGHEYTLPPIDPDRAFAEETECRLGPHFIAGKNVLEIDIHNEGAGPMALRWKWIGRVKLGMQRTGESE